VQPFLQWKSSEHYILEVCVCSLTYPASNAHPPHCHLWPFRLYNIFPYYLINGTIFEKRKSIEYKMFWSFYNFFFKNFLIISRTERDMTKNVYWSSRKVTRFSYPILIKLNFLDWFSKNIQISNFMKIHPVWAELFHTNRHGDAKSSIFCNLRMRLKVTTIQRTLSNTH
jgi:hypothetical protein